MNIEKMEVKQFHEKHGFAVGEKLRQIECDVTRIEVSHECKRLEWFAKSLIGDKDLAAQRVSLILEEAAEVCESLAKGDVVELADGLADLIYVVIGTAVAYGLPISELFDEVHRSNMTKNVCDEPLLKGKTSKGAGYSPPNIRGILEKLGGLR